jgi:outer membrane protein assembly factor BamB
MRLRCLSVVIATVVLAAGCDWTQFRFGSGHTGHNPDNGISVNTVGSLALDWTATMTGPVDGSPAVVGGVVYIGADQQFLHALDAAGTRNCSTPPKACTDIWTGIGAFGARRSSPAVAGNLVYLGSDVGDIYAFDRGCPGQCDYSWVSTLNGPVYSSPAISAGVVYIASYAEESNLYAFDAAGGSAHCDQQYQTCNPLWTAPVGAGVTASPAVANGIVYIGGDQLYAFDAAGVVNCSTMLKTCAPLWTAAMGGSAASSPMASKGTIFIGSADGKLYAFDAAGNTNCSGATKTCKPLWTAATGGPVRSSPAYAGGVVYVGSDDGKLYAFDGAGNTNCSGAPKTCKPLWTAATGGAIGSSPAVANSVVYVGSADRKLYAFDAHGQVNCAGLPKTCGPLWSATTGGAVNSSPAVAGGFVYVGSDDGRLYAFKPSP